MIVINQNTSFILFQQHQHGLISGEMAKQLRGSILHNEQIRFDVEFAIANHDYAWLQIDQLPLWNCEKNQPYSFIDYPLVDKIEAYTNGITYVQQQSEYAGLLCSLHYTSFFKEDSANSSIVRFISQEIDRRNKIKDKLQTYLDEQTISYHLDLLQFCDDLSLYLCLNEPGVLKEEEHPWFKNGFRQRFEFANEGLNAKWLNDKRICVEPFPFHSEFQVALPYKQLDKEHIEKDGLQAAFQKERVQTRVVIIGNEK